MHFFKSIEWDPRSSKSCTFTAFTNTLSIGLGLFLPSSKLVFQCPLPSVSASKHIFFFEALAVCLTFHYFAKWLPNLGCNHLVVYTDSSNTVNIFNFLWASAPYNCILISAMDVILDHDIDFWVLHVCGMDNPVADAIYHFKNDLAVSLCPGLVIQNFKPPQDVLGVVQVWCRYLPHPSSPLGLPGHCSS